MPLCQIDASLGTLLHPAYLAQVEPSQKVAGGGNREIPYVQNTIYTIK